MMMLGASCATVSLRTSESVISQSCEEGVNKVVSGMVASALTSD